MYAVKRKDGLYFTGDMRRTKKFGEINEAKTFKSYGGAASAMVHIHEYTCSVIEVGLHEVYRNPVSGNPSKG